MITLSQPRHLLAGVLTLILVWTIGPGVAEAGKPDFSVKTHVVLDESNLWTGTWTMNGVVHDSGAAAVSRGYMGLDTLWVYGEAGSMEIGLITFDPLTEERVERFVVTEGSGVYETWVGASGTFNAHFSRTNGGQTLKGLLP